MNITFTETLKLDIERTNNIIINYKNNNNQTKQNENKLRLKTKNKRKDTTHWEVTEQTNNNISTHHKRTNINDQPTPASCCRR